MPLTAFNVCVVIALILAVAGIIKPQWPCVAVSVLLICVALLAGK